MKKLSGGSVRTRRDEVACQRNPPITTLGIRGGETPQQHLQAIVQAMMGRSTRLETEVEESLPHLRGMAQEDPGIQVDEKFHAGVKRFGIEGIGLTVQDDGLDGAKGENEVGKRVGQILRRFVEGVAKTRTLQHAEQQRWPFLLIEEFGHQLQYASHLRIRNLVELDALETLEERRGGLFGRRRPLDLFEKEQHVLDVGREANDPSEEFGRSGRL
ncbi:MAG: hypothetical protein HRU01_27660 [Myxococcales bacterium]|nr:hypothetical protein [Myxococcales bacterium]